MAVWFARTTGSINSTNKWNSAPDGSGSWLTWPPASNDVLMANGLAISINVNTVAAELRNDTANGATVGGAFTLGAGVSFTGNAYMGTSGSGVILFSVATGFLVGNYYGGSGSGSSAVFISGTGTLTITGNVYSGTTGTNCHGVRNTVTGTVNITGNSISQGGGAGVSNEAGGTITVSGYTEASSAVSGIRNTAQGVVSVGETRNASNGQPAVSGAFRYASISALVHKPIVADGSTLTMKPASGFDMPSEATVRNGVSYGGDKVGTLTGCNRHHRMSI